MDRPLPLMCRSSGGFKFGSNGEVSHECRCGLVVHDPRKGHLCDECDTVWSGDVRGRVVAP